MGTLGNLGLLYAVKCGLHFREVLLNAIEQPVDISEARLYTDQTDSSRPRYAQAFPPFG